ncbi:hypothetical protein BD769DRAFT_1681676 [Suillus cothurnatus]|nr:hypothetical protein BD769DRAFT_1681676 [Suillus cothurnatus]
MPPLSESPNYSSSSVGVQMHSHGHAMPPLSPLPPSHGGFAFDVSYPPSDVIRDNTMNMGPTPIVPSQAHIHFAPPQPYLAEFIPGFAHPVLSQDGDALLPQDVEDEYLHQHIENAPGVEDESLRDLVASTENPEDDSTFRFYRGLNDRRGRKRKRMTRSNHLQFDNKNSKHRRIVRSAKKEITKHALNKAALTEEADRVALAEKKLEAAAKKVLGTGDGMEWASQNSGTLYMILSEPCKNIMKMCKKRAFELVLDGFDLRLSIWSTDSELEHQETMIADLIDDSIFPPKFLMGSGTDDKQHFLENTVVLHVMLDTIRELKLIQELEDLDSLACLSAVAVRYALDRVRHGISPDLTSDVEFSGAAYRDLYTTLMTYIEETIKTCPELRDRWEHGFLSQRNVFADTSVREFRVSDSIDNDLFSNLELSVKEAIIPTGTVSGTTDRDLDLSKLKAVFERCGAVVTERKSSEFTAKHVDDNIKKITIDPEKDSESAAPIPELSLPSAPSALSALISYLSLLSDPSNHRAYKLRTHNLARFMRLDASALPEVDGLANNLTLPKDKDTAILELWRY